jgi:hypothetical protein
MPKKTRRRTSVPKKSPASEAPAIAHEITEAIKQVSGVEFTSHQQESIEELLSSKFAVVFTELKTLREGLLEEVSEMREQVLAEVSEIREKESEIREMARKALELLPELKFRVMKIVTHTRDIDKSRAAHARQGRSKSLRERTIAQGVVEKTKGWDGKHHFKKAQEIQGAINALLAKAGLKTARGTPQTYSVEALSRRLKALSEKTGSARSN